MSKEIILSVNPQGESVIETSGFAGASCTEESNWLKVALGKETSKKYKTEYFSEGIEQKQEIKHTMKSE